MTSGLALYLCSMFPRLLRQVFTMYDADRKGQLSMQEVCSPHSLYSQLSK